jgi:hypothetical protein
MGCLSSENDVIIIFEADIHLGPLPKSILDIYKKMSHCCYAVSRAYGCTLILLHQPSWPQIRELWCVTCGVGIML